MPYIRAGDGKWLAVAYNEICQLKRYDMRRLSPETVLDTDNETRQEIGDSGAQSVVQWIGPDTQLSPENAAKLADWDKVAAQAYPSNTLKAWASDWRLY